MGTEAAKRQWRYTRVGSVLLSYDFFLGVPVGVGLTVPAGFSAGIRSDLPGLLLAVAGIGVAVAAVVLTSLTLLLTTMSNEYRLYLQRTPNGADTLAKPYRFVVVVAALSSLFGLAGAMTAPLVDGLLTLGAFDVGTAMVAAPGLACAAWSVLGFVQVTNLLIYHWNQSNRAVELQHRLREVRDRSAS